MTGGRLGLTVGALAGFALATAGALDRRAAAPQVPAGAVAVVDGRAIDGEDYRRAVATVAAERDAPLDPSERRRVLDRLVDEELLVRRGLELDLARRDPKVRNDLAAAVIDVLVARGHREASSPSEDELRRFWADNRAWFRTAPRLHARQLHFAGPRSLARARVARARLVVGAIPDLVDGDRPPLPLPDAPLPPPTLRTYLGATALAALADLEPGGVTAPLPAGDGHRLLLLIDRRPGLDRPFESVRAQVRAEWLRRAGERSLRRFLDRQRDRVRIAIDPEQL